MKTLPLTLLAVALLPHSARGQILYGGMVGNVTDASSAAVPGATVTIVQVATGTRRDAVTNEAGTYRFPTIAAGAYDVTVTASGFRTFTQSGVEVTVNSLTRVEARLEVGEVRHPPRSGWLELGQANGDNYIRRIYRPIAPSCVQFRSQGLGSLPGPIVTYSTEQRPFSLLGTMYGGDGRTTFALPDLRGRSPIGLGSGPGLSVYTQGDMGGAESVTVLNPQMPVHGHSVGCVTADPGANSPAWAFPANGDVYSTQPASGSMNPAMIGLAGGSQPHDNHSPYQVQNWIICLQGIFPSRS